MNALIDLGKCREYMTVTLDKQSHKIGLNGTIDTPYFCYKDVSDILGYKNSKDALYRHVDGNDKISLQELKKVRAEQTNLLGSNKPLNYNEGKAVYITETGLYSLIDGCGLHINKKKIKSQIEKWIVDLRYGEGSGLMDIFSFVKGYNLTFDINSNWFQDLWYPLSKSNPLQLEGVKKVDFQPIIVTQNLLEWMGFKGKDNSIKQFNFSKVLRSHEIPYDEIGYQHPLA